MNWPKTKKWLIYIENATAFVYIVLILGSIPFLDLPITAGILLGGALGLANFDLLIRIGEKVFFDPIRPRMSYFAFSWIKFGILLVILFFTLKSGIFHPVALIVGVSDFVLGIFLGTILWAAKGGFRDPEEEPTLAGPMPEPKKADKPFGKLKDLF